MTNSNFKFLDTDFLRNDEIYLKLNNTSPADKTKGWVETYHFYICTYDNTVVGRCDLRVGHNEQLFYGGNIGYSVLPKYRGNHYSGKACLLLFELAKKHDLEYIIITCNPDNLASRRICEYIGGVLEQIVDLPVDNDMRIENGETQKCIYRYSL